MSTLTDTYTPALTMIPAQMQQGAGDQMSGMGTTQDQGIKAPVPSAPEDPTQGFLYKALAPFEQTAQNATDAMKDTTKMYQGMAQNVSQWGQDTANANGYIKLGDAMKKKFPAYADLDSEKLGKAVVTKHPEYMDIVSGSQGTLGTLAKMAGGVGSMVVSAPGMVTGGAGNIGEGVGTMASAQNGQDVAQGMMQTALGGVQAGFGVATGAMPFASTALGAISGTDTGGAVLGGLSTAGGWVGEKGSGLLGANEQTQQYAKELGQNLGPLIAMKGLSKGGEYVAGKLPGSVNGLGERVDTMRQGLSDKIDNTTDAIKNKTTQTVTGLDEASVKGIQANPYLSDYWNQTMDRAKSEGGVIDPKLLATEFTGKVADDLQSKIEGARSSLSENGPVYQAIRENPIQIDGKSVLDAFKNSIVSKGLDIGSDGQIVKTPSLKSAEINTADIGKMQSLYDAIQGEIQANGGHLTSGNMLDARKVASNLAKYDANTTTAGTSTVRAIRSSLDAIAKEKIKGLKEIDKNYADKIEAIDEATRDLVYKQGQDKGTFISNFDSKIKNLLNDRNTALRERLQEVMPDLVDRIEAIQKIPELYKRHSNQSQFVRAIGGAIGVYLGNALGGGFLGSALGGFLGERAGKIGLDIQKKAIDNIVSNISDAGFKRLEEINKKIEQNENISKLDRAFIEQIKEDIANEIKVQKENLAKKQKDTKIEKSNSKDNGKQGLGTSRNNSGNSRNNLSSSNIPDSKPSNSSDTRNPMGNSKGSKAKKETLGKTDKKQPLGEPIKK